MKQLRWNETSGSKNDKWFWPRVRTIAPALLAAVGIYLCYRLAQPCIPSLVWAGALALVFTPLHRWIETKVRKRNLAAAFSLVLIGLLVVVPATWFTQKVAEQTISVPENIQKQIAAGKWHISAEEHPHLAHFLASIERQVGFPDNSSTTTNWLKPILSRLVKESAVAAIQVCLTLYFLFYFLRDRIAVLRAIQRLVPLSESETDTLFSRVNATVHATLYGMLALSALQGVLGGLLFWYLGIPSPWFWALVAGLFAFVPVVDTLVLWLPAAVYLGLEGRWGEALVVAGIGSLLVRALENFLYPVLVNHRLRVPSVSVFVALLGGLLLFGWSGLVLGPVILTVTSALLEICASRIEKTAPEFEVQTVQGSSPVASMDAEHRSGLPELPLNPDGVLKGQTH